MEKNENETENENVVGPVKLSFVLSNLKLTFVRSLFSYFVRCGFENENEIMECKDERGDNPQSFFSEDSGR